MYEPKHDGWRGRMRAGASGSAALSEAQRNESGRDLLPLRSGVALLTWVGRRGGIGCAIERANDCGS